MFATNFNGNSLGGLRQYWQPLVWAIAIFFVYRIMVIYSVGQAPMIISGLDLWLSIFGENTASAIAYMQLVHFVGLLAASIPVALILVIFQPKVAVPISILIALILTIWVLYSTVAASPDASDSLTQFVSTILDAFKFMFTLPLLTCLAEIKLPAKE